MKKVMIAEEKANTQVGDYFINVKTIVRLFKQSGLSSTLPTRLVQEIETRFSSSFQVV